MSTAALYIHIPWCIKKCPYCDFNSHQTPDVRPESAYVDALLNDFETDVKRWPLHTLTSIFIGGGTPSLFSARAYEKLFDGLKQFVQFADDIEITLEANPGRIDTEDFAGYRAIGINRLSIGVQSFNDNHLKALGRIHTAKAAETAVAIARMQGFNNINLDLMYGLPNQTVEEGLADLTTAIALSPEHISWYQLTLEPNTVFYKRPPKLPSEETEAQLEALGLATLADNDFKRYEISAFCRDDQPSKHNLHYWQFGDYYAIGAGAHGKITQGNTIYRFRKQRQPQDYLNPEKVFMADCHTLDDATRCFEFMLNTSRLETPIALSVFETTTGLPSTRLLPKLRLASEQGLITLDADSYQVTPFGRRYTNDLQALFLPDDPGTS